MPAKGAGTGTGSAPRDMRISRGLGTIAVVFTGKPAYSLRFSESGQIQPVAGAHYEADRPGEWM